MKEEKKTFTIGKENWKKCAQIKLDQDLEGMDEVITYLLKNQKKK